MGSCDPRPKKGGRYCVFGWPSANATTRRQGVHTDRTGPFRSCTWYKVPPEWFLKILAASSATATTGRWTRRKTKGGIVQHGYYRKAKECMMMMTIWMKNSPTDHACERVTEEWCTRHMCIVLVVVVVSFHNVVCLCLWRSFVG
jgi:hypothetical protein